MLRFRVVRSLLENAQGHPGAALRDGAVLRNLFSRLGNAWHSEEDLRLSGISRSRIDALVHRGFLDVGNERGVLPREVHTALRDYFSEVNRSGWQFEPQLPVHWFGLPYQSPLELRHSTTLGCVEVIDRLLEGGRPVTGLFPSISPDADTDSLIHRTVAALGESGGRIGVIGGDHRVTWSLLKSVKAVSPQSKLGCITFDAHHDLYGLSRKPADAALLPSNYNAFLLNSHCIDTLVLVGNRDSLGDFDCAVSEGLNVLRLESVEQLADLKDDCRWHLSVDVDVLDTQYAPGVSNPLPRGWSPDRLMREVEQALLMLNPTSMSVVEVAGQCAKTANEAVQVIRMIDKTIST